MSRISNSCTCYDSHTFTFSQQADCLSVFSWQDFGNLSFREAVQIFFLQ